MGRDDDVKWMTALRDGGKDHEATLAELRLRIFAVISGYLKQNYVARGSLHPEEARHLAEDCTQDAMLAIQRKLDSFRGESKFSTWAYSIAIRTVLGELRRQRWRLASIDKAQLGQALPAWPIEEPGPERSLQQREAWMLLTRLIETALTPLQRTALVAHAFQGMPLDEVAEWLGSNRNSLYKLIHDARKRLKRALLEEGVTQKDLINIFDAQGDRSHPHPTGKTSAVQRVL